MFCFISEEWSYLVALTYFSSSDDSSMPILIDSIDTGNGLLFLLD